MRILFTVGPLQGRTVRSFIPASSPLNDTSSSAPVQVGTLDIEKGDSPLSKELSFRTTLFIVIA
jgi:hypothetical protein